MIARLVARNDLAVEAREAILEDRRAGRPVPTQSKRGPAGAALITGTTRVRGMGYPA